MLSLEVADQVTVQRFLTARSLAEAKRSCVWSSVGATIAVLAAVYVGLVLLAFYHDHPQAIRPIWVANVDPRTRQSVRDSHGIPLLAWSPRAVTPDNLDELVAQRRLLRPNTNQPFEAADDLIVFEDGQEQVSIPGLAKRRPPPAGLKQGEVILNELAQDELLPHFITSQYPLGVTGLLLAACWSHRCFLSRRGWRRLGLCWSPISTVRLGIGRHWLARRLHKPVAELDAADELRVGRWLVLVVGAGVTASSLGMARIDSTIAIWLSMASTLGGPLLAVFLLGMFTRRTTATAALTALIAGTACSIWLLTANHSEAFSGLWPWSQKLPGVWSLTLGFLFSLAWGYLGSWVLGERKSHDQLRGLVAGIGAWGICRPEASIAIPDSFETVEEGAKWQGPLTTLTRAP